MKVHVLEEMETCSGEGQLGQPSILEVGRALFPFHLQRIYMVRQSGPRTQTPICHSATLEVKLVSTHRKWLATKSPFITLRLGENASWVSNHWLIKLLEHGFFTD